MDACSVEISGPGQNGIQRVGIRIVTPPMDGGEAIRTRSVEGSGCEIRARDWGPRDLDHVGRPGVVGHSTCSIPRGKGYVEVDVTASAPAMVSLETVRTLVQKADTRL